MRLLILAAVVLLLSPPAAARSAATAPRDAAAALPLQPDGSSDGTSLPPQQVLGSWRHDSSRLGASAQRHSSQLLVRRVDRNVQLSVSPDANFEERLTRRSFEDGRTKVLRQEASFRSDSLVSNLARGLDVVANLANIVVALLVCVVLIYFVYRHYSQTPATTQVKKNDRTHARKSFLITDRMSRTESRSLRRSDSFEFPDLEGLASAASRNSIQETAWSTSEDSQDSDSPEEEAMETADVSRRRGGVSAEATGAFNKKYRLVEEIVYQKTLAQKEALMTAFGESPFFRNLSTESYEALAGATEILTYEAGARIIVQGTTGRSCYVLLSGTVHVVREEADEEGGSGDEDEVMKWQTRRLSTTSRPKDKALRAGSVFGETAMLWQTRRSRTLVAMESCIVGKFKRDSYFHLVTDMEMATRSLQQTSLKRMALFETLDD